jgi:thioredoxin 1
MKVESVVDRDFDERVLRSSIPVLVACRASYCLPSQQLVPIIDEIAGEFSQRVRFLAADSERDTVRIRRRYRVTRLPVTMLFDEGRCVDFIGGWTSKDAIVEMIERRLKPVLQADEFNFDEEVLESRVPVLVHFNAAWCTASQPIIPVVDKLAEKFKGRAKFVRVEFGPDTARLCARFGVKRVPTLSLFVDGQIEDQIFGGMVGGTKKGAVRTSCVGLTSSDNVQQMLEHYLV